MNITTAAFLELTEHAQRALILDSILYVKAEMFKLTTSMAKLNTWMATMDLAAADDDQVKRYQLLRQQYAENGDSLTEQFLVAAQKLRHLDDQVKKRIKTPQQ